MGNGDDDDIADDEPNELARRIGMMENRDDDVGSDDSESGTDEEDSAEDSDESMTDFEDMPGYCSVREESDRFDTRATLISSLPDIPTISASPMPSADVAYLPNSPAAVDDAPHFHSISGSTTADNGPEIRMETRKRRNKEVQRSFECVCGEEVPEEDRGDRELVVRCQAQGCETIWVWIHNF